MWVTAVVSYPLALLLDYLFSSCKDSPGALTGDQLAILIKSQERSESNPCGTLGRDATRVVLGALNLDGRRIDRVMSNILEPSFDGAEKDVEKAEIPDVHGLIVKWCAVKTIDINELVDQGFINKLKCSSYSRIPVIGNTEKKIAQSETWEGNKIFGFLHVKVRVCHMVHDSSMLAIHPSQSRPVAPWLFLTH